MKTKLLNRDLRRRIIEKGTEMESGHFGSAFSCLDTVKYLYDNILREERDIFIMSKGHGEMALFAVLESLGKKPKWTIHLDYNEENGIYATTGSLGHGLPIALGRAIAKTIKKEDGLIYVLLGDGEMEEGSNWEALTIAYHLNIKNLNLLIDWNKYQATDAVSSVASLDYKVLTERLQAFGCNTMTIDGHDIEELSYLKSLPNGLNAVILDTIKGKGVPYLEEKHSHGFDFNKYKELYKSTLEDLK
mgnify:CR=1 FL=1